MLWRKIEFAKINLFENEEMMRTWLPVERRKMTDAQIQVSLTM